MKSPDTRKATILSRREALFGLGSALALAGLPAEAEAAEVKGVALIHENIDASAQVLEDFRARFGEELVSISKELKNRLTGEAVRFLSFKDGRNSWLYTAQPGAFVPFAHRHEQAEIYTVLSGAIDVCINGEWAVAQAGETLVIPAMALHEARNPFEEPVEVQVDFDPFTPEVQAMGKVYWLACELGWLHPDGSPKFTKLIGAIRETGARTYPEKTPKWLVDLVTAR